MTLAARSFSAARWTVFSTVLRAVVQLVQIAVLARFLSPADFGLMAMLLVVQSYVAIFGDMGLSTAFVQRQQISLQERSSLYWLSVAIGGALMLIVMVFSPLIGDFFGEQPLVPLIFLLATNFLVIALGQQLRMDAEKTLNFKPVAVIEMISALVGLVVAIAVAWAGGGVYALLFSAMAGAWVTTILYWLVLSNGWRPMWRLRWNEVRSFLHFGGGMVLNNAINHVNATVDLLIGGRLLGAGALGLYSVPRNLVLQIQMAVNPIITRIGFPLISSIQHDRDRVKAVYLKTMNVTASINAPIYVALAIFAPEIVFFVLGPKWDEAVPLQRVLALWGLLRSFGNPAGSLLFGLGFVKLAVKWNLALLLIVPPAAWLGSQWGAIGMAWSMIAIMAVLFIPGWAILVRPTCGASLMAYSRQVAIPSFCAVLAGLFAFAVVTAISVPWIRLGVGLFAGAFVYLFLTWLLNRELVFLFIKILKFQRKSSF